MAQQKHFRQRMGDPPRLTRVFDGRKMIEQRLHARLLEPFKGRSRHGGRSESLDHPWNQAARNSERALTRVRCPGVADRPIDQPRPCCHAAQSGHTQLPKMIQGVKFNDGIEVARSDAQTAAA
jgi:hypothetical protein